MITRSYTSAKCVVVITTLLLFLTTNITCQSSFSDEEIRTSAELKGLNSLIYNTEIEIADVYLNKELPWPLPIISLTGRDIKCGNFSIGSIAVKSPTYSSTYVELGIMADDISVDCELNFTVATEGSVEIEGSGFGKVFTEGNSLELSMGFVSEDFTQYPPYNATVDNCNINIKVKSLEIDTPIPLVDNFIEQFKPMIETELNSMVTKTGCAKLSEQVQKNVPPLLDKLTEFVESTKAENATNTKYLSQKALKEVKKLKEDVLDLTDTSEDNPSAWFVDILNRLSPLLSFPVYIPSTGQYDMAVNYLLRSLTGASGGLEIAFEEPMDVYSMNNSFIVAKLAIGSATVHGFDSFESFSPFNISGPYRLRNDFAMDKLLVDLDFELQFHAYDNETTSSLLIEHAKQPNMTNNAKTKTSFQALAVDSPNGQPDTYKIAFTLSAGVSDLNMTIANVLAMAVDKLSVIDLACLSFTEDILGCFLSPVLKFMLLKMKFNTIPQVVQPTLSNSSNGDIQKMLNPAFESVHHMYGDMLEQTIPKLLDVQMRRAINPWIAEAIDDFQANHVPREDRDFGEAIFIDYRDLLLPSNQALAWGATGAEPYGDLVPIIKGYLDKFFESSNSSVSEIINSYLLTPYTIGQSGETGVLRFPATEDPYEPLFSVSSDIYAGGLQASIVFHSPELRITNVDTFTYPFQLLQPTREDPNTLENVATMAPPDAPLRISVPIYTSFKTPDVEKENYMEVSLELHMMQLILDVLAKVNATAFFGLTIDQIYANPCEILGTIPYVTNRSEFYPTFSIPQILFSVQEANLGLRCISCGNPDYWEKFISMLETPEGIEDTTNVVNNLSDYVLKTLFRDNGGKNIFQSSMDEVLKNATNLCVEGSMFDFASINVLEPAAEQEIDYLDTSSGQIMYIALSLLVLYFFFVFATKLMHYIIRRSFKEWFQFFATPEKRIKVLKDDLQRKEVDKYVNLATNSMMKSSNTVPCILRWGMPIIFVANMALFLSGHLNLGATVSLSIEFGGQPIARVDNFYFFWLGR